jgi:hypothetical protein
LARACSSAQSGRARADSATIHNERRASPAPCSAKPLVATLLSQSPLELSHGAEQVEHQLACGGRRVLIGRAYSCIADTHLQILLDVLRNLIRTAIGDVCLLISGPGACSSERLLLDNFQEGRIPPTRTCGARTSMAMSTGVAQGDDVTPRRSLCGPTRCNVAVRQAEIREPRDLGQRQLVPAVHPANLADHGHGDHLVWLLAY